ncbi:hypothetical protein [Actinomyces sp.]
MRKMTDLPQEERLKPDHLRSMTECERAIHAIAEKTGKSPLDIWRVNETWLSERASRVDWDVEFNWYYFCVSNFFMFANLFCQLSRPDWYRAIVGAIALLVLGNFMIVIYFHRATWIRPYGRFLRNFASAVFSLALTLFGSDFLPEWLKFDLIMGMVGVACAASSVALFHLFPELLWNHSVKKWEEHKKQLAILWMVRPLFVGEEEGVSAQMVSRSSQTSRMRLRTVVDWD